MQAASSENHHMSQLDGVIEMRRERTTAHEGAGNGERAKSEIDTFGEMECGATKKTCFEMGGWKGRRAGNEMLGTQKGETVIDKKKAGGARVGGGEEGGQAAPLLSLPLSVPPALGRPLSILSITYLF